MSGRFQSVLLRFRPVFGAALFWLVHVSGPQSAEQMSVAVVIARQEAVTETIPVVGSLVARDEVQVHPFTQSKIIEHVLVEVGQMVEKGQPLALLDTTEARMQLDKNSVSMRRAQAAVAVEESRLEVADVRRREALKVVERSQALQPKGAVSQQALDEHENTYARSVAEFALARQSLSLAEADAALVGRERDEIELTIERATVRAPASGLVLRRTARVGAMTVGSVDPLFVLARDAIIEFVAQVTETSLVRLGEGMSAEVMLAGHAEAIDGIVRLNAAELDPATRSGEVRIELGQSAGLKPGMFARGTVTASVRRNILLPGSAVKTASGASKVFIVDNGIVGLRQVMIGARQGGFVEIVEGVRDGEMILLKSGGFVEVDERVKPVVTASDRAHFDRLASFMTIETMGMAQ